MPSPAPARNLAPRPPRTTRSSRTKRRLLAVTSLGLAGLLAGLLSGCASGIVAGASPSGNSYKEVSGNWQFSSAAAAAARLAVLGGNLTVNGSSISGILHPLSGSKQCLSTSTPIPVTGSIDSSSHLTLSSSLSDGTLTISGDLSADRRSLSGVRYTVIGGACAFPAAQAIQTRDIATSPVTAQQYQPVSGTYTGTLTTSEGEQFPLTSTLTQSSQPDANGVYHVDGTAASPGNKCVPTSLSATASTIAGGSISTTYTDALTGTSITGTGSASPDGNIITISSWTINSLCGSDTGTGTLTR